MGTDAAAIVKRWTTEVELAQKEVENWDKAVDRIIKRYKDDRGDSETRDRRFNILWSNIEVLKPAMYNREPLPVVERRFSDSDPVARTAAMMLERAVTTEHALSEFNDAAKAAVLDYLLSARGVIWVRYTFEMGEKEIPGAPGQTTQDVIRQNCPADHIHRKDFLQSPARCWKEVRWVGKRAYMTRDELIERFGEEVGKEIPLDFKPDNVDDEARSTPEQEAFKKAKVWEIWDKPSKKVYWISTAYKEKALDIKDAPLDLRSFFPCPRPAFGTLTNDSLVPIPDYEMYRDQAEQIDEMTARISLLIQAIRAAGLYAADQKTDIERLVQSDTDNVLIPVDSWAALAEKGGLKGIIEWLPIQAIVAVLLSLFDARERVKKDLWEVTGLSDLFRGQTVASETATAQRLKGQFASLRVDDRKNEIRRLLRDTVRIQCEIIAEKFYPDILVKMSGIQSAQGANLELIPQAIQLLHDDDMRNWSIEVETDDSQLKDPDMEKQSRIEFITAIGGFLERAVPLATSAPTLLPVVGEMLMFAMRGFKVGRAMESAFEQALPGLMQQSQEANALQKQAQQQAVTQQGQEGETGNPEAEMASVQIEAQKAQASAQTDQAKLGLQKQAQDQKFSLGVAAQKSKDRDMQFKRQIEGMKFKTQQAKTFADIKMGMEKGAADMKNNADKTQAQINRPMGQR